MKTKTNANSFESLSVFALSNEEMITVRGGGEPMGGSGGVVVIKS